MLLHVTGRKSGRVYAIPVVATSSTATWWPRPAAPGDPNLAGGVDLEVTLDGRRHRAHGELVEDPHQVAQIFSDLLDQVGLKRANRLGLKFNVDRAPTMPELSAALATAKSSSYTSWTDRQAAA